MKFSPEWAGVCLALLVAVSPFLIRSIVRWAANGKYVSRELYESEKKTLREDVTYIRGRVDEIMENM